MQNFPDELLYYVYLKDVEFRQYCKVLCKNLSNVSIFL